MFVVHCSLFIGARRCHCYTYVHFAHVEIGFVLRKKRLICRGVSTSVEGRRGKEREDQVNRGPGKQGNSSPGDCGVGLS